MNIGDCNRKLLVWGLRMNYRNELHEKRNSYAKIAESQRPRMKAGSDKLRRIVILVEGILAPL